MVAVLNGGSTAGGSSFPAFDDTEDDDEVTGDFAAGGSVGAFSIGAGGGSVTEVADEVADGFAAGGEVGALSTGAGADSVTARWTCAGAGADSGSKPATFFSALSWVSVLKSLL